MNPPIGKMMNRAIGIRPNEAERVRMNEMETVTKAEPKIDYDLEAAKRAIAEVKKERKVRELEDAKQLDVERIQRRLLDQVSGHDA
jgi:uncharacterized protein YpuA (DUF1002 family)